MTAEREENPALGWRALRIGLDRPALLRFQLRALIAASEGRALRVMFPLVSIASEFDAAKTLVDRELLAAQRRGREGPTHIAVGAMLEAPSLAFAIDHLAGKADFLSIGTNDLMQYFFAADRGNARVADRYDILSPPALRFLRQIREQAAAAGVPLSLCGEHAGRPLEALALVALGFETLSMPAAGVGPVKAMLRSLDARAAGALVNEMCERPDRSVREPLRAFARETGVTIY
jgi:phosphotransferase system enzyme I (PtsP)